MTDRTQRLEEIVAHQSAAIEDLSDIVARQTRAIEKLEGRVALLLRRAAEAEADAAGPGNLTLADAKPPHY